MRTAILTLPVLSTILACGPGAPGDTDTDPTTAGTSGETGPGTSSDASTTAEPATTDALPTTATTVASETSPTTPTSATTDALPTTGVETTGGETTDATTGPVETATADPSTTTTTGETDGAPDVAFAAQFWAGGLDHINVRMAALKDDFCVEIHFARPGGSPVPQLMLPTDWWYQGATVSQGAADCLDFMVPISQAIGASSVAGVVTWDTEPFCPTTIDSIDLVLDFPPDQPWVPAQVPVATEALAVSGC
ncbi:hypothetical protein OV079_47745 [Nannocystis pusilla]|uniref:Uncharacterized protein n=1 Tax=Nannocystis pusilla TaxID=889268 RepID=A0A9X3EZE0_9BACT|nr:hypothetical protein [Nannocystis pusilla]MCY1013102.1 hypothetical protein [Nannocystis pusilla]